MMPRFLFDIECRKTIVDRIKADLPDMQAAGFYALRIADIMMVGREGEPWRVTIKRADSSVVKVVTPAHEDPHHTGD